MQTIQYNGTKIAYRVHGAGEVTLLFVHGAFINQTYWADQIDFFRDRFKIVTLDLAKHGESTSDRADWGVESFGTDIVEVIKQLELQKVILIGHSLGAAAILEAASAYPGPVIGFVGIDNFKDLDGEFPEELMNEILGNLKNNFTDTVEGYVKMGLVTEGTRPDIVRRIVEDYRRADPDMGYQSIQSIFTYGNREKQLLAKLGWTLHLLNSDYMANNADALSNNGVQAYELEEIHGTSHFPMIENPVAFNKKLDGILNKILEEAKSD